VVANDVPATAPATKPEVDLRRAIVRTLFSAFVAILSLLILMVAALQQQATSHLGTQGYTSAHAKVWARRDLQHQLALDQHYLVALHEKVRATIGRIEESLHEKRAALASSNTQVMQLAQTIQASGLCPTLKTPLATDDSLWGQVYQCWFSGTVPEGVRAPIKALAGTDADPTQILDEIGKQQMKLDSIQDYVGTAETEIMGLQKQLASSADLSDNMADIVQFDESPLGWLGLTWIPPATMQIVLSFVSGLFGSLLVTLVLAVYPNNDLHFTGSDSYWNRILLGGLIAVGIYIVLGGGMAVLSAGKADPGGATNFLSFCAIGMMAGMFSDKFAGWLSRNADKLTSQDEPERA
jgi:hypothetical protein